jgi:hypothetical protein
VRPRALYIKSKFNFKTNEAAVLGGFLLSGETKMSENSAVEASAVAISQKVTATSGVSSLDLRKNRCNCLGWFDHCSNWSCDSALLCSAEKSA